MSELTGPVLVVGAGLLGTSVGLACRRAGLEVLLSDVSDEHLRTASGMGAGRPLGPGDEPQLVVVAVPEANTVAALLAEVTTPPSQRAAAVVWPPVFTLNWFPVPS